MQKERFGIYPKEMRSVYNRDTCTPTSIAALCTIAKIRKRVSQQMEKENVRHTHTQWNLIQPWKKEGILPFATTFSLNLFWSEAVLSGESRAFAWQWLEKRREGELEGKKGGQWFWDRQRKLLAQDSLCARNKYVYILDSKCFLSLPSSLSLLLDLVIAGPGSEKWWEWKEARSLHMRRNTKLPHTYTQALEARQWGESHNPLRRGWAESRQGVWVWPRSVALQIDRRVLESVLVCCEV